MAKRKKSAAKTKRRDPSSSPTSPSAASTPRGASSARGDLLWALGLSFLAWVHRYLFLQSNRDREWPFTLFYEGDSEAYFRFARSLLQGEVYDEGLPFHPPGFAYVLSWVHSWLGAAAENATVPHFQVKALLAAIASLSVGFLYLLIRPYLGRPAAVFGCLFVVYHFGLYVLSVAPVTEGVYLTLYLAAWWLFVRFFYHPLTAPDARLKDSLWPAVVLGILCGFLALTRAEAMLLPLIFVALGLWGTRRRMRGDAPMAPASSRATAWAPWWIIVACCALTIAPWTLHNYHSLTELNRDLEGKLAEPVPVFVPITVYGPLNLALANNSMADGSFSRDFMSSQKLGGNLDLTDPQHLEFILHGDRMARQWILSHPGEFISLVGKKWLLASRAWSLGWSQWNWPGGLAGVRRPVDVMTPHRDFLRWIWLPYIFAGLLICAFHSSESRRWLALTVAAGAIGAISITMFFGYVRQGLLLMPWAAAFSGVTTAAIFGRGLGWIGQSRPFGRWFYYALPAFVAVMLVIEYRGTDDNRNFEASGSTIPGSHKLNRDQPIELTPLPPK